jgi:hypothetical protein
LLGREHRETAIPCISGLSHPLYFRFTKSMEVAWWLLELRAV